MYNTLTLFDYLTMYIIVGCISTIIINLILDWADRKGALSQPFNPTTEQRIWGFVFWPVTAWIFWYNFWKSWFDNQKR